MDECNSKSDEFDRHELMDRLYLVCNLLEEHIVEHDYFEENPRIKANVELALRRLTDAYEEAKAWALEEE